MPANQAKIGMIALKTSAGVRVLLPTTVAENVIGLQEYVSQQDHMSLTSTQFSTQNPVLPDGAIGVESNTGYAKLGDGTTAWNSLTYIQQAPLLNDMTNNFDDAVCTVTTTEGTEFQITGGTNMTTAGFRLQYYDETQGAYVNCD